MLSDSKVQFNDDIENDIIFLQEIENKPKLKKRISEIIRLATKYCKNREIVIYGAGNDSIYIYEALKKSGLFSIRCFVDRTVNELEGVSEYPTKYNVSVYPIDFLINKSDRFFVCVSLAKYDSEIEKVLYQMGYSYNKDYCYCPVKAIRSVSVVDSPCDYQDERGNMVIGSLNGATVKFKGCHSIIRCDGKVKTENFNILVDSLCDITLDERVTVGKDSFGEFTTWDIRDYSKLTIGAGFTFFGGGLITCAKHGVLQIDASGSVQRYYHINLSEKGRIEIGRGFMGSLYLAIFSNDAHPFFDIRSGKCLNVPDSGENAVRIEDWVWIGYRSVVMGDGDTVIGQGSIVGCNSMVRGKYPNNCIIAGTPAKVIRKGIAWARKIDKNLTIDSVPVEYIAYTQFPSDYESDDEHEYLD